MHSQMAEARRLSNLIASQLSEAARAGDRSVMADSDAAASASAKEALNSVASVQSSAAALKPLLDGLGYTEEGKLLERFNTKFENYRTLEGDILALAVEASNAKAQRLSFGAAQEAADSLKDALGRLTPVQQNERWNGDPLIAGSAGQASIAKPVIDIAPSRDT